MFRNFMQEMLYPASRRLGTITGTYLAANGYGAEIAEPIAGAVPLAVGVLFDLGLSSLNRNLQSRKDKHG